MAEGRESRSVWMSCSTEGATSVLEMKKRCMGEAVLGRVVCRFFQSPGREGFVA